jgi:hypothetical protein
VVAEPPADRRLATEVEAEGEGIGWAAGAVLGVVELGPLPRRVVARDVLSFSVPVGIGLVGVIGSGSVADDRSAMPWLLLGGVVLAVLAIVSLIIAGPLAGTWQRERYGLANPHTCTRSGIREQAAVNAGFSLPWSGRFTFLSAPTC